MAASQTQAAGTSYQVIQTRYVRERQIIQYLNSVHGKGNYILNTRRGKYYLEAPSEIPEDLMMEWRTASPAESTTSLPRPRSSPVANETAPTPETQAPTADNIKKRVRLRRRIHMDFGSHMWDRLLRKKNQKGDQ